MWHGAALSYTSVRDSVRDVSGASAAAAFLAVLVSARTELTFFLVAGVVLCFGFSMRITLITH